MAGGVSAALARAWESNLGTGGMWWHLADSDLKVASGPNLLAEHLASIPQEVIKGHYRFCNEFLWPIMHDLPQYCNYVPEDRAYYDTFNYTLGWCLIRGHREGMPRDFFVQDYQLALLPAFLSDNGDFRSLVFWHIPWPKQVAAEHASHITEIAKAMLSANAIGFHTDEYAQNFLSFIEQYLPQYSFSRDNMAIWSTENISSSRLRRQTSPASSLRTLRSVDSSTRTSLTRLVVAPLGIDHEHWSNLASRPISDNWHPVLAKTPFILSVDRADYTKGVVDRVRAIDELFQRHPEWKERIVFAQICGKTRTGLRSFDQYWEDCRSLYNDLTQKHATEGWKPLLWIEESFGPAELAKIYRSADGMLVNAVRDGLNLTAKEFVACQDHRAGVLALSQGTGAWSELGSHAVQLEPSNPSQIAEAIHQSLTMSSHERGWRMAMLKAKVKSNSLSGWWYKFSRLLINRPQVIDIEFEENYHHTG